MIEETVIGFDLERRIILLATDDPDIYEARQLTGEQVIQIRAHWRWLRAVEARNRPADDSIVKTASPERAV